MRFSAVLMLMMGLAIQCRRWRADRFASNMLTYQAPTSVFALTIHVFRGALVDATLWAYILLATPGMLLGGWLGHRVSAMMPDNVFKKVTIALIGVMGVRLLSANAEAAAGAVTVGTVALLALGVEGWRRRRDRERLQHEQRHGGWHMVARGEEGTRLPAAQPKSDPWHDQ